MARKRSRSSPKSKDDEKNEKLTKKQKLERRRAKLKAWREKKQKEETKTKMTLSTSQSSSKPYGFLSFLFLRRVHNHICSIQTPHYWLHVLFLSISRNSLINSSHAHSNYDTHLRIARIVFFFHFEEFTLKHLFNTYSTFILCDPFLPISTHSLTNSSNAYSNYYHYTDPFSRRSLPRRRRRKMRSWRRRRRMSWIRWRLT